jgi:hypothetical protein
VLARACDRVFALRNGTLVEETPPAGTSI